MRYISSLDELDEATKAKVMMSFFKRFMKIMADKPHVSDEKLMQVLGINRETLCKQFPQLNQYRASANNDLTRRNYKTACNRFSQSNTF
jgi:hypothetical protein